MQSSDFTLSLATLMLVPFWFPNPPLIHHTQHAQRCHVENGRWKHHVTHTQNKRGDTTNPGLGGVDCRDWLAGPEYSYITIYNICMGTARCWLWHANITNPYEQCWHRRINPYWETTARKLNNMFKYISVLFTIRSNVPPLWGSQWIRCSLQNSCTDTPNGVTRDIHDFTKLHTTDRSLVRFISHL